MAVQARGRTSYSRKRLRLRIKIRIKKLRTTEEGMRIVEMWGRDVPSVDANPEKGPVNGSQSDMWQVAE